MSADLSEVASYICNIIKLISQILHSILDVKMCVLVFFLDMHTLIHFLCCKGLQVLANI